LERETGPRLARACASHRHARAHARVAPDRGVDRPRARGRAPLHQREVLAFDLARGELRLQAPERLLAARDDHQARGVLVQPVHDPGALRLAAAEKWRQQLRERVLAVPATGVHDQPRALVDHEQVLVLVDDEKAHRSRPRSITITSTTIPIVIEASAMLKGGQPSGSLTKSVTEPARMRSTTLPTAPPIRSPVGSQIKGRSRWRAK